MIIDNAFEAAGYALLDKTDQRSLGEFPTWEKEGVRIALYGESLWLRRGKVLRHPAEGSEITLHGIIVDLDQRLKGKANAAMQLLLDAADRLDVAIYIEPAPMVKGGMNRSQLVAFYESHGFVGMHPSNKVMRRLPGAVPLCRDANAVAAPTQARIDWPGVAVPEVLRDLA